MSRAAVCYREFRPCGALRGSVRALFSFSEPIEESTERPVSLEVWFGSGERVCAPTFADAHACIVFSFARHYCPDGAWRSVAERATGSVMGPMTTAGPMCVPARAESVGVYLRAGCIIPGAPANELENRTVALEDLWGPDARELAENLNAIRGESARIACLEAALVRRMIAPQPRQASIDIAGVTKWIVEGGGQVTVECLAEAVGLSRQHFTRVFRENVGVSPKAYCQLARFQSTLAYVQPGNDMEWAQVAAENGYADQSHMIAEFRRFTGMTPEALLHRCWFHPFIERRVRERRARMLSESCAAGWGGHGPYPRWLP
jgi:AraC-like DNA-binding protein